MNDNLNGSLEKGAIAKASSNQAIEQTMAVTIQLPLKFVKAIKQRASQSGQSHTEVILEALQQLLETEQVETAQSQSGETQLATLADLRELSVRLSALEGLADRVDDLEGKRIAS